MVFAGGNLWEEIRVESGQEGGGPHDGIETIFTLSPAKN